MCKFQYGGKVEQICRLLTSLYVSVNVELEYCGYARGNHNNTGFLPLVDNNFLNFKTFHYEFLTYSIFSFLLICYLYIKTKDFIF